RAAIRRQQRAAQGAVARAVGAGAAAAVSAAESSLARSNDRRAAAETATIAASETLKTVRAQATAVSAELDAVVNTAHGTEISRNEHRLRLEQLASHATDEYGVEPDALVAEYGPGVLILVSAGSPLAVAARKRGTAVVVASEASAPAQPSAAASAASAAASASASASSAAASSANADTPAAAPAPASAAPAPASALSAATSASSPSAAPAPASHSVPSAPTSTDSSAPTPTANISDMSDSPKVSDGPNAAAAAPGSLADALRAVRTEAEESEAVAPPRKSRAAETEAAPEIVGVPYVRAEQEERAAEADRQLTRLGKVNPLALEEYEALVERHQFLATQLEDLRKTRRDLLMVVKEVDDRVQEVFASAYADTAREFEGLFSRLFPGGQGRLILTEPDDMLTTGIEIEARPPGKKVKRLSLLSGGERSLTAIAYLFAIFKARPSPFYVLDEVEAALDDSNLQRLLGVFGELQESSQLIVITHQRRTMEAADSLYGVSMRGDGVSTVISQRVRESEPA
ncbi:MAG TPA: AAA family ATPase, partial [Trebonia sp.]